MGPGEMSLRVHVRQEHFRCSDGLGEPQPFYGHVSRSDSNLQAGLRTKQRRQSDQHGRNWYGKIPSTLDWPCIQAELGVIRGWGRKRSKIPTSWRDARSPIKMRKLHLHVTKSRKPSRASSSKFILKMPQLCFMVLRGASALVAVH